MDLRTMEFAPLSEVKAKLSEFVRKTTAGKKRVALTTNGRPSAVILSYEDFLDIVNQLQPAPPLLRDEVIDFEEWEKNQSNRKMVRDSLLKLFDPSKLSRKGQKYYKKGMVESFERSSEPRARRGRKD